MPSRDYIKHRISPLTAPTGSINAGDEWYDPVANKLYKYLVVNGTTVQPVEQVVSTSNLWTFGGNVTASNAVLSGSITASGYFYANGASVGGGGVSLSNLPAGNLVGTISSTVLGNSTAYIGTTAIALNRASAAQSLTGVSIDGAATELSVPDLRSTALTPSQFGQGLNAAFMQNSTDGLADGGTYHGVLQFQQWTDASGGGSHQLGFTDANNIWHRGSSGALTAWSTWYKLLDSNNYSSYASPLAGSASLTTTGTVTAGTWSANIGAVSGANLTSITAGNLSGTISSTVLGNSTHYVGTTAITLNRASATQSLTGVSIDGSASTVTTAAQGNITSVGTLTGLTSSGTITQSNTTANVVTSVLTHAADNLFQLTSQNGPATNASGQETARFGINYSGTGWDTFTQYVRGSGAQSGWQVLYAANTAIATVNTSGVALSTGAYSGSGAGLTNLPAGNLVGTISSTVLGNSTHYVGTTAIALNRASASQSLTGITSIDGSAATLTTARNINGVSFNGSADVVVPRVYDSSYISIINPTGAAYTTATASLTGAIAITLPVGMLSTMIRMTIRVYHYATGKSFDVYCGGYTYSVGNTWANNPFAYIVSNSGYDNRYTVRFGYTAGGKAVIYIGELASTWAYPQIAVTDVQCGYSGQAVTYTTGWTIGFQASAFENVTATITNPQVSYSTTANTANAEVLRDASGNFSAGVVTLTGIVNGGTTGTGNIGSSTTTFNTVFAKATTAQYADLAENYTADAEYEPGTVVCFGGDNEVTISTVDHDTAVAGIVSTNPAYLMNSDAAGLVVPVAMTGRVPCKVYGPVKKGDVLVTSAQPGVAQKLNPDRYQPGCVIGKALDNISANDVKTIEVVAGRF